MNICNKEMQSRKKVTIEFLTPKNKNLSYIEIKMTINFYTSTVMSYILEATGTEKLQGQQNLSYLKNVLL